jgi:hypothetical protein
MISLAGATDYVQFAAIGKIVSGSTSIEAAHQSQGIRGRVSEILVCECHLSSTFLDIPISEAAEKTP